MRGPDEKEANMRRCRGVRRPKSSKPEACTERCFANRPGLSVPVRAQYPAQAFNGQHLQMLKALGIVLA